MSGNDINELFNTIQKACTTPVWSQGSRLFRMGIVEGVSDTREAIELHINLPGAMDTPEVVLYPLDGEWECSCDYPNEVCAHAAAAIIAVKQAQDDGTGRPKPEKASTKLSYRFSRHPHGLVLKRFFILPDGREEKVVTPLVVGLETRRFEHGYRPSPEDLTVDRLVGRLLRRPGPLNPRLLLQVLSVLKGADNLTLDDRAVIVSDDPYYPEASVESIGDKAIALSVSADPAISEVLAPGVGRAGDSLVELKECELAGQRWEKLPIEVVYEPREFAELAATVVPELQKRISVDILTERLPDVLRFMRPRLMLSTEQSDRAFSVFPELVYGDPPNVRIADDKMVYVQGGVPVRDRQKERALLDMLRDELNLVINRKVQVTGKEAVQFLERIQRFSEETLDPSQQPLAGLPPLLPRVTLSDDVFQLTFVLEADSAPRGEKGSKRMANPQNVLSAWREGLSMAPLDGGGWAPIPKGWLSRYGHMVQDILDARLSDDKVAPAAIPILSKLAASLELPHQPCFDRLRPLIDGFERLPEAAMPPDLTATLRSYQKSGVNWLAFLKQAGLGGILADDMGLGKTVQTLAVVSGKTLVVAPTSVLSNWASEADRFRPGLKVSLYHGPKRTIEDDADLVLTTYALLRIDLDTLLKIDWDMVVLDEAQFIKNPASQVAKAAYKLKGAFRLALSGTPVENRLDELWSLFHFCNRGLLSSRPNFQKRFADPIGLGDETATARLRDRIGPFVLRRLKRDVAPELPPRIEQTLHCELETHERNVYDAVKAAANKVVVETLEKGAGVMAALEALLRLRQSACHPALVPGHTAKRSSKLALLLDQVGVTVESGHKALVFSQWTSLLDLVEPLLQEAGVPFARLDGSTRDRRRVVDDFQNPNGPPILLISLKAGGTGLNLTEADHVFLLDPWWNPAVEDQAADRAHRIGQTKPVMVYRLVAKDTVEERIMILQAEKRRLADAALGAADKALSLTKDDLLSLLA